MEKQHELLPTLDIAEDICDYIAPWDRADADIFTIAHGITTDLDSYIEYFENEYSEYMDSGLPSHYNKLTNILENLKAYKATRTINKTNILEKRYFNMKNTIKGFKAVCSMTRENRYFHFWTRAYFNRRNNQVFSVQFISENDYIVFPDDDIFEWLCTDRIMTISELKEYFQKWYDTDYAFKTTPIF